MTNQSSRSRLVARIGPRLAIVVALVALVLSMDGTWSTQPALAAPTTQPAAPPRPGNAAVPDERSGGARPVKKEVTGKLNLNTATEEQLMMLPTVGPSKAERIVVWRKKNGGFKRTADLRRVKGFGYRTFKRLEPFLDVQGDTTLVAKH